MKSKNNPFPWTDVTTDQSIGGIYDSNGDTVINVQHVPISRINNVRADLAAENKHRRELTKWVANACSMHNELLAALESALLFANTPVNISAEDRALHAKTIQLVLEKNAINDVKWE